jgi:hypothetical protein
LAEAVLKKNTRLKKPNKVKVLLQEIKQISKQIAKAKVASFVKEAGNYVQSAKDNLKKGKHTKAERNLQSAAAQLGLASHILEKNPHLKRPKKIKTISGEIKKVSEQVSAAKVAAQAKKKETVSAGSGSTSTVRETAVAKPKNKGAGGSGNQGAQKKKKKDKEKK